MTVTNPLAGQTNDDIDLLSLIERSVNFLKKYRWLFFISALTGLLAGWLTWRKLTTVYKARLIVHSYTLSNLDYMEVMDGWNNALKKGGQEELASIWEIPVSDIRKVKQLKATEIQKVFTANNPNGFYIDAYVTDNEVFPSLQKGIVKGFENIDFIKRQMIIKKDNFRILIAEVEKEIQKLDSTKSKIESSLYGKGSSGGSIIVDITGVNKQLIEMNEKLLNYKQEIQFICAVQIIQGFIPSSTPAGPHLIVWLGLGFVAAICIAYAIALFISINSRLKARSKS